MARSPADRRPTAATARLVAQARPLRAADRCPRARPSACPTPSCTATPTSASSTARASPRSSSRRPRGSASTRSRSPTTTASTAWSASPRRPSELGVRHGVRRRALARPARPAERRAPTRRARHLLVLARDAEGYRRLLAARSAPAQLRGGEKGRPVYDLDELADAHRAATGSCSPAAARARCAQALRPTARRRARASSTSCVERFGRDNVVVELTTTATRSTPSATTRWPRSPPTRGLPTSSPPATRTTPRPTARRSPRRWPRCAPAAASTTSTAGCPPAGTAHLRSGAEMAARFARYPGAVDARRALGRECAFDLALVAPNLPPFPVPPGHTEMTLAARAHLARRGRGATAAATEHAPKAVPTDRARADDHRGAGLPRLLPDRLRHRRVLPPQPTSSARAAARPPTPRSATRSASPTSTRWRTSLLFERFLAPDARRAARHRPRHRVRPPRGGHPVRLRHATAASTPRRSPTSSPTGRGRRCATSPRRSGYSPGQQDAWSKQIDALDGRRARRGRDPACPADGAAHWPTQLLRLPPPPRHPLRRHGDLRPSGRRGGARSSGRGCRAARRSSGTRTTAPRSGLVKFDLLGLGHARGAAR